jgi:Flp pilus assembly protein TadG
MKKILLITVVLLIAVGSVMLSQRRLNNLSNVVLKGWVWAENNIANTRTWGVTGTADTVIVGGIPSDAHVFLTPNTATGTLRYSINGDTLFVTSSASETASTDKYDYLIIR